jgi:hypothetical protein
VRSTSFCAGLFHSARPNKPTPSHVGVTLARKFLLFCSRVTGFCRISPTLSKVPALHV